jgi:hypothetical protein
VVHTLSGIQSDGGRKVPKLFRRAGS